MKTRAKKSSPRVGRVIPNAPLRANVHAGKLRATSNRRVRDNAPYLSKAGFSLIEMIGVMAIMAILATILVPNVLRSIERAAIRAEVETVRNLGEQAKLYLRDNGVPPNSAVIAPPTLPPVLPSPTSWNSQIATYASLSALDIFVNRRQMQRVYVTEPATLPALPQRALIISSMRTGVAPQTAAYIGANMTRFNDVWNWNTEASPLVSPTGWGAWNTNNIEFLVIERVNFVPVFRTDLANYIARLNNTSLVRTVSYRIVPLGGTPSGAATTIAPGIIPAGIPLSSLQQLYLYSTAAALPADLDYIHVGGTTTKAFTYVDNADGTNGRWLPITP